MSWNSTFIAINHDYSAQFDKLINNLGLIVGQPVRTVTWEEATSSMATGKSIGFGDGWTVISDPFLFLDTMGSEVHEQNQIWLPTIENGLKMFSNEGKALGFIMSGVSGTYGMTIHENGELSRCRLIQEGEIIMDVGAPSPQETEVFAKTDDEEDRVLLLMKKFGLTFEILQKMQFTLYASAA